MWHKIVVHGTVVAAAVVVVVAAAAVGKAVQDRTVHA